MKEALVSIIMPTFNHGEFIQEAIDSVIAQTYISWELIIINNYSTDNTEEIIAQYKDSRIKVINFNNGGIIARARNKGIAEAKGEFIAFLDSDDIWYSNKLEIQIRIMRKMPDILACSTSLTIIPKGVRSPYFAFGNRKLSKKKILKANMIFNSSVILRYEVVETVGALNENKSLRTVEDYDYWLRILSFKDNSFCFIDKPLVYYRISSNNASMIGKMIDIDSEWEKYSALLRSHVDMDEYEKIRKIKRSELARRYIETALVLGINDFDKNEYSNLLLKDRIIMFLSIMIKHRKNKNLP